ncbi:hypothetical protein K7432_014465 [Basidiobolus ranarum]|uniref:B30.2/SPRY domain-containing protein n=1 Tax=Basidiobolus ranarum TaxID=34480 RepID=A0ABR2WHR8_9FUNG
MSNTMTQKIIQSPCTNQLMLHILNGDHGKIQRTCAKTLVILANHETSFFQRIFTMIVEPLIEHTIDLGEETILSLEPDLYPIDLNRELFISNEHRTDRPLQLRRITLNEIRNTDGFDSRIIIPSALLAERFINFIRTLHIFVEYDRAFEDFISQNKDPQSGELFEGELLKLLRILIDKTSLPLVNSQMPRLIGNQDSPMYKPWEMEGDARNNLSFMVREYFLEESSVTADSQNSPHFSPKSEGVFGLSFDIDGDDVKKTNDMEIDVKTTKVALCNYALNVLVALSKYSIVRNYLIEHDFLKTTLLVQKLCRPALENSIIAISIILSKSQLQKCLKSPNILVNAWRGLFKPSTQTSTIVFYTQMLLSHCSNYSLAACESVGRTRYLGLRRADRTKHLMMLKDNLEVRNELWTFGSVRATRGVQGNGRYAYEVKLNTDGLVQLGWASKLCRFDPEGGSGVGDDIHSYSYDGQRSKKWHGICPVNNQYGDKWSAGDIITSCIDLDHGTIEYYRNGLCLGVAFTNVSSDTIWYPALSLASGQGCRTYFGGKLDPLRYLPKGYKPVASILEIGKIDPNTNTEGKLDISLSPGLGSMNVVSVSNNRPSSLFETNHTTSDTIPSYLGQVMLSSASYLTEEPDFISLSEETSPTTQDQSALPSTPSESESEVESKIKCASDNDVCKLTESNEIHSESRDASSTTHHQTLIDEESNHQQTGNSAQADQYYSSSKNAAENESCTPDKLPHLTLDDELAENSGMMFSDADLDLPFSRMLRLKGIHPNVDLPEPNFVDAFYFEVCLGLRGLIDGLYPQIGMIDRDDTIYMLIMGPRESCTATIQHSHLDETFFRSIPRDIMEPRSDEDQAVHSDILSFEIINDNNPITHGDYVGCGYSAEERTVFFTLNGNLLARIPVPNQILLLPYIRYVPRSICNFGQEQFQYQPAYSIVTQMIDV